jgi:hypothetical protein
MVEELKEFVEDESEIRDEPEEEDTPEPDEDEDSTPEVKPDSNRQTVDINVHTGMDPAIKNIVRSSAKGRKRREEDTEIASENEVSQFIEDFCPNSTNGRFIRLSRLEPKNFRSKKCDGFIEKFDRIVTLEEIKDMFGGGTYEIRVYGPKVNAKTGEQSGNRFLTSRRFSIVGDPIILANQAGGNDNSPGNEIVSATIRANEKLAERESERAERNSEKFESILMKTLSEGGGSKELIVMMQGFMANMQEQARHQIEMQAKQLQVMQDKYERDAERAREESRISRKESEERSKGEMSPLLALMIQQSKENVARSEAAMAQSAKMAELQITSIQKANEMQMNLIMNGTKTQVDVLMKQLDNVSGELKDARSAQNKDAMSELKKLVQLKDILKDLGGTGDADVEKPTITDKIMENLPQIQEAFGTFMQLFTKPQAPGVAAPTRQMLNPGAPPPPPPPRESVTVQARPIAQDHRQAPQQEQQPASGEIKEIEIAILVNKLKTGAESYMESGKSAAEFIDNEIFGKFDEKILRQIAITPTKMVIDHLEASFGEADPDSALFTMRGKDFLKSAHAHLKSKLGMQ